MSVRTLLLLVVLLLGGGSIVGHWSIQTIQKQFDQQLQESERAHNALLQLLNQMQYTVQKMHMLSLSSVIRRDEDLLLQSSQQPRRFLRRWTGLK